MFATPAALMEEWPAALMEEWMDICLLPQAARMQSEIGSGVQIGRRPCQIDNEAIDTEEQACS